MRYTYFRSPAQVSNWVRLKFVAINIKKFAKRKRRDNHPSDFFAFFSFFLLTNAKNTHLANARMGVFRQAESVRASGRFFRCSTEVLHRNTRLLAKEIAAEQIDSLCYPCQVAQKCELVFVMELSETDHRVVVVVLPV